MDIELLDEEENPMLHRTDIRFEVVHNEATPSRLSVRDSLAARINKDAEEVVIHKLDTKYGMRRSVGYAKVYETADEAKAVEQEYMLQRNKIGDGEVLDEAEDDVEEEPEADTEDETEADAEDEAEVEDEAEAEDEADTEDETDTEDEAEAEAEEA